MLAAVLGTALAGCSAASTARPGDAPVSQRVAATTKADALLVAVQGYSEALLTGDVESLPPYLHPDCASAADQRAVLARALDPSTPARGTLKVETVEMSGDSGRIGTWRVAGDAPAKLKSRVKAAATEQADGLPWRYIAGEWHFRPASCGGAS